MIKKYGSTLIYNANLVNLKRKRLLNYIMYGDILESLKIEKISQTGFDTFFGYYDKTPYSKSDRYLLILNILRKGRSLDMRDAYLFDPTIVVGLYDRLNNKYRKIGETETWCWQQGCRLQWYPSDEERLIIYNKSFDGTYCSVIQDIMTREIIQKNKLPIYDISPKGDMAFTLNFSRLNHFQPGYGYGQIHGPIEKAPSDDGLWSLDLNANVASLIISFDELKKIEPKPDMEIAYHNVNHIAVSPNSNRLMFIHYWFNKGTRFSRLCTSDFEGKNVRILQNGDKIGHYCWKNGSKIVAFIKSGNKEGFYMFTDLSEQNERILTGDIPYNGHLIASPINKNLFVCDTIQKKVNHLGERKIVLYNLKTNETKQIGLFYSPLRYRGWYRCDLHPRWNREGTHICIDSTHEGTRAMYEIDIRAFI